MSIKVQNVGTTTLTIALGSGVQVQLRGGDFVYSADARLTNSLLIYQRKKLITIQTEEKPAHLQYNAPYNAASLRPAPPVEEKKEEPVPQLDVQNVGGQIVETKEALKEALQSHDDRGNKGDIPEEVFEQIEEQQSSVLDEAKDMVSELKGELKSGRWTDDEVKLLRKTYPIKGLKESAKQLNRSEKSVQKKVEALNLRKRKKK